MRPKNHQMVQKSFLSSAGYINTDAYLLFKMKHEKAIQFGDFRIDLIRQLIERYAEPKHPIGRPIIGDNPIHLTARHFSSLVPPAARGNIGRRACIVCNHTDRGEKKRAHIRYQCDVCNLGLCVIDCFGDCHTLKQL